MKKDNKDPYYVTCIIAAAALLLTMLMTGCGTLENTDPEVIVSWGEKVLKLFSKF